MKIFLDTNVILDFLLEPRAHHETAADFIRTAMHANHPLVMSTSQATDVYHTVKKALGPDQTRHVLRRVFQICELYPTSETACVAALDSPLSDYEDAVQVEVAREARCDYIVTRDLRGYGSSPVPFIDPAGYLALLRARDSSSGRGDR